MPIPHELAGKTDIPIQLNADRVRIIRERDALVRNSRASTKLDQRIQAGKDADILSADADGTLCVRTPGGIYIGKNEQTSAQLASKNVPFLVNTARPGWSEADDAHTTLLQLPLPDIVIAGTGGMVYWRNEQGDLVTDPAYLDMLEQHRVTINGGDPQRFTPHDIVTGIYPTLHKYAIHGLREVLVDPGPIGANGEEGLDGIRLVARNMPYGDIREMTAAITGVVSGIKLQLSEITHYSTADNFSGWIHIIPSITGKDRALRYVLDTLATEKGHKMIGHALGDTSIDIPMLTMGTSDTANRYEVRQYALSNMPERARAKLETASHSQANHGNEYSRRLPSHLHLTMLDQAGPDGVAQVVNSLA